MCVLLIRKMPPCDFFCDQRGEGREKTKQIAFKDKEARKLKF